MARNSLPNFYQAKKKTNIETKHKTVVVERLDHHGAGIAFQNKKPIFIEGALPSEKVVIQLTESKSKFSRANLIKVLEASEDRVEPFCPHFQECGGCNMQHLTHDKQVQSKSMALTQLFDKFAGGSIELQAPLLSETKHYRRRARFSMLFDKKSKQLNIGFRKKQSKQIVRIQHCPVLDESLNELLPELSKVLNQFSHPMELGHIELVNDGQQRIILLRHLKPLVSKDKEALMQLATQYDAALYLMPEPNHVERLVGEESAYTETGSSIAFQPNHFIQVNPTVNRKMVQQAVDWLALESGDQVLDLFCGVGNFTIPIAQTAQYVVGVEGIDEMVKQAQSNAVRNHTAHAHFYQANLEAPLAEQEWAKKRFNKILLDPARAGASGIVDQLSTLGAERVVYVSCNPATLARDSQSLIEQGYTLTKLGMLDMFPHTSHLESMALFVKN